MKIRRLLVRLVSTMLPGVVFALLAVSCAPAFAEDAPEALRPPKGTTLALVVFEDLQCPQCGRVAPLLVQASKTYKIPLVQHDFPLPMHNWSFDAAVMARYFDTHSKEIGNEFRATVFEHQMEITPQNLRAFEEKFATEHKIGLPFVVDPDGKLAGLVRADKEVGVGLHIDHTPTIWVVSSKHPAKPYVEVTDTTKLYLMIDEMKKE
ncbi:MAG: thioredoxin domain-containing protein [Terriglobales bacterium]